MSDIINGKLLAQDIRNNLKEEIKKLYNKFKKKPGLAVIQIGEIPASTVYVKAKTKKAIEVGIEVFDHKLNNLDSEEDLIKLILKLNKDENVNGILVQLPLPKNFNEIKILETIDPKKDVDGFHPYNVGILSTSQISDKDLLIPCTPQGCLLMLKNLGLNIVGKKAVIIGRSNIVGKPMASLLLRESCTVTIAHSKTELLPEICKEADILIAAVGKPEFVKGDWIKKNSIVIDVGINRIEKKDGDSIKTEIVGDVCFEEAKKVASFVTPVPGGVGPMTIACLLKNTTTAFKSYHCQ